MPSNPWVAEYPVIPDAEAVVFCTHMAASDRAAGRHLRACEGFGRVATKGEGSWDRPSPCTDWDARGVVEHVIGFHDVLLLRPIGMKPDRPRGDPATRWAVTVPAIASALERANDRSVPESDAVHLDLRRILPMLTLDVLVHTWDLARAIGCEDGLDPELCEAVYGGVERKTQALRSSGMFGPAVAISDQADATSKLVAFLGRDPYWSPRSG